MNEFSDWVTAVLGFMLTVLSINYKMDKKRQEDTAALLTERTNQIAERLIKVESELMTEREVRRVLKDYFDPFISSMQNMQKDVQDIKVHIASLPNRKE